MALASFSEGRLVDKLKSAALLSPVAYLTHMQTPLGIIAAKAFVGEVIYPTCTNNNISTSTNTKIISYIKNYKRANWIMLN